jgi:D-alanine--poly(phosphoribitol) ligase subunit 2
MTTKNEIIEIIFKSIEEINQQNDIKLIIDKKTKLYGKGSDLDSLGLVNLITTIEAGIEESTGKYIPIADERAFSSETSPFKTIETLADYIEILLHE